MSMQDPIADMLTRIRNAQAVKETKVKLPSSTVKLAMLAVLKEEGFIEDYESLENENKKDINITLKYYMGKPVIEKIVRISKPSLRLYKACEDLPIVRAGMGVAIISTSNGIMTAKTARAKGLGGEVLCTVE